MDDVDHEQDNGIVPIGVSQFRKIANIFFWLLLLLCSKEYKVQLCGRQVHLSRAVLQGSDSNLHGPVTEAEYLQWVADGMGLANGSSLANSKNFPCRWAGTLLSSCPRE